MKRDHFTLIELMTAMVIILVLAGMIMGASSIANKISKKRNAQSTINSLEIILEQYKTDWGFYPESNGVLELGSWSAWYHLNLREPSSLSEASTSGITESTPTSWHKIYQDDYVDLFAGAFKTQVDENAITTPPVLNPTVPPAPSYHNYFVGPNGSPLYIVDPYLQPFYYRTPGIMNPEKFDLWSKGPDGEHGKAGVDDDNDSNIDNAGDAQSMMAKESDDIANWGKN